MRICSLNAAYKKTYEISRTADNESFYHHWSFFLGFHNICMRLYYFLATLRFHSQNYYSLQRKNTGEAVVKAAFIVFNH